MAGAISDTPDLDALRAAQARGPLRRHGRFRAARRGGCVPDLRADPARRDTNSPISATSRRQRRGSPSSCGPGMLVVLESTTYPGTCREVVRPILEAQRASVRRRLLPRLFAGARGSGQSRLQRRPPFPASLAAMARSRWISPARSTVSSVSEVVPGRIDRGRGGGQDHRERLPRRQHRARQRAQDDLRRHGHRRVAGHRRRQHQALRLHAVLSGTRSRRPLRADRSLLSHLEGARARRAERGSSSWPARSTTTCRAASWSGSPARSIAPTTGGMAGQPRPAARAGLQAQHRRHAGEPGLRLLAVLEGCGAVRRLSRSLRRCGAGHAASRRGWAGDGASPGRPTAVAATTPR